MKIKNITTVLICLLTTSTAFAHCPSSFKEEKVCMMLDDNTLYIYDQKLEHNGPYKDLDKARVVAIKSLDGKGFEYKKIARGIYKFESKIKEKKIILEVTLDKKNTNIQVAHE